jgi:hypothetical protein
MSNRYEVRDSMGTPGVTALAGWQRLGYVESTESPRCDRTDRGRERTRTDRSREGSDRIADPVAALERVLPEAADGEA